MILDHYLTLYTKINSKWIKDPKLNSSKERRRRLYDIGFGSHFLGMTKAQATKAITDKWNYIKLKDFCALKNTISRVKRQLTEWEKKICKLYIS